jgi:hypothetical protein
MDHDGVIDRSYDLLDQSKLQEYVLVHLSVLPFLCRLTLLVDGIPQSVAEISGRWLSKFLTTLTYIPIALSKYFHTITVDLIEEPLYILSRIYQKKALFLG